MALTEEELEIFLQSIATASKRTTVDGTTVENHSASELIELYRFLASDSSQNTRPFRIQHFNSPGTVYGVGKTE